MNKIRTEVGDPVRAAEAAALGACIAQAGPHLPEGAVDAGTICDACTAEAVHEQGDCSCQIAADLDAIVKAAEDAWTAKAVAAEPSGKYEPTDEELYGS